MTGLFECYWAGLFQQCPRDPSPGLQLAGRPWAASLRYDAGWAAPLSLDPARVATLQEWELLY